MLMRTPHRWVRPKRLRPPGFIVPCQPALANRVPGGPGWLFEVKYDGIRVIARKDGDTVRIWSRYGRSRTADFVAIVKALRALRVDELVVDGEAVAHCPQGLPDFNRTLTAQGQQEACLYAFDVLVVAGEDLRLLHLLEHRRRLQGLLQEAPAAIRFSEHMEGVDGEALFRHACALGLEGIVAKRGDRPYRSGRCTHWVKIKNPDYARRP